MKQKFYLPEMLRGEVKEAAEAGAVVLVPVATIEQHREHLPLHTDIDNVTGICKGVAERLNPDPRVLVGAPFWLSPSPWDPEELPYFMVKMRKEVYMEALNDILESYLRTGFKKVVVVNGHGGATERWIPQVIDRLNTKRSSIWPDWHIPGDAQVVGFCWISFLGEFAREELKKIFKGRTDRDWHGGEIETSLQLYLRPELVDMSKAKADPAPKQCRFAPCSLSTWHRQFIIDGYYKPGTICNDPTLATKETGEKVFNLAVEKIGEFIREFSGMGLQESRCGGFTKGEG
ncbi:MAG TPA: creatininase family protein [Candidatus Latescibacteria bacterium]|nr:creatininase family protein [Candidatus Latescibacterota bacterium]